MLPSYNLFIHPAHLMDLRRDIWNDEPIPAKLNYQNRKYDIDLAYRGALTREFPKKSYHIQFYKPSSFLGAKELHLNAEYKDLSLIRNKLSLDFFQELGTLSPHSQHVLLSINGQFQGVYLQLESVDEQFLQKRALPPGSIYYAVDDDANFSLWSELRDEAKQSLSEGYELKCGNQHSHLHLEHFIYQINTLSKAEFAKEIQKHLHVDAYLRWLVGIVCTQNYDGFVHNYALYRNGETGLFEIIPWDYDATWGRDIRGRVMRPDYIRIDGHNTLSARLLDVPAFRKAYADKMRTALSHHFTPDCLQPKIETLYNEIRPYVSRDPHLKQSISEFEAELPFILQYIEQRRLFLRTQLQTL